MKDDLLSIWENLDNNTFHIELDSKIYTKNDINNHSDKLIKKLINIADWENRRVYLDMNDRFNFVVSFISLLRLKSKIVLVPSEIKAEDYIFKGGLFLSDNKQNSQCLFLDKNNFVRIGDDFDVRKLEEGLIDSSVIYLYTSGSTGKAKLIPKKSLNLITELKELKKILKISKEDLFYFTPPLYHIYGLLFGFLLPVYSSCKVILDFNFTPDSIADFIEKRDITHFVSIPSYYRMFVELNLADKFNKCNSLLSSSAPLPLDISKHFYEKNIKISEIYGSTETGGIAYRTSAVNIAWKLFSYVKILNSMGSYMDGSSKNKVIELKLVSPAISVEYDLNNGFNTGDVVELSENNDFILLGRNTRFIKISGKRVDLHYVLKKVLNYLIEITNKDIKEDKIYVNFKKKRIYVICEEAFPKKTKELIVDLKKHLPSYAVPRIFIHHKIPRNKMGKIDKQKIENILNEILIKE